MGRAKILVVLCYGLAQRLLFSISQPLRADVVRFAFNNVEADRSFSPAGLHWSALAGTGRAYWDSAENTFIQSRATLPVLLTTGLIMAIGIYIPILTSGRDDGWTGPLCR